MRFVELCFHERDAQTADLAVRGLTEAGLCVLRRPASDAHAPAASSAAERRIVLHSAAFDALAADHPIFATSGVMTTVAVPLGNHWPLRSSRPWLIAPADGADLRSSGFWKVIAWASARAIPDRKTRIATQKSLFRALRAAPRDTPVGRRRPSLSFDPLPQVRGARDWGVAVTPLAVVATLVVTAGASAIFVDVAARPEAWGVIAQTPSPGEPSTNPFNGRRSEAR
jgi:hypothetical protein